MAKVIGVKFKNSGKSYFFDPAGYDVHKDDHVIVETGKGIDYGFVVSEVREISDDKLYQPLKPILRKATDRDEAQVAENHEKEKEAFRVCQEKVREHNLDMKLTETEYAFDNSKILFYFTSDGYVDFRELVKDLACIFKTRIELRQIGVRDEARALGGLGACGRPMCCAAYLNDFVPVSIKMAKEQNLPLNPTKISGVCGRLMCCLKYEEETYEELNKTMPDVGDFVEGSDGLQGDVFSTDVLRQMVKVLVEVGDEKEMHDYTAEEIKVLRKRRGKKNVTKEEAAEEKQLAALEDKPLPEEKSENRNREEKNREDKNRDDRKNDRKAGGNKPHNHEQNDNREINSDKEVGFNRDKKREDRNKEERNREDRNRENREDRNRDERRNDRRPDKRFEGKAEGKNSDVFVNPDGKDVANGNQPVNGNNGQSGNGGNAGKNHHHHHRHFDKNKGNRHDRNQGGPAKERGEN